MLKSQMKMCTMQRTVMSIDVHDALGLSKMQQDIKEITKQKIKVGKGCHPPDSNNGGP